MRKISFKLLAQIHPITIETNAKTTKELALEILRNDNLSRLINVETMISSNTDGFGTSTKTINVLVDPNTMNEYYFDVDAVLPEGDILLFVTPVTSKFGITTDKYRIIADNLNSISKAITAIEEVLRNDINNEDQKKMKELQELEIKAQEIKKILEKRYSR